MTELSRQPTIKYLYITIKVIIVKNFNEVGFGELFVQFLFETSLLL